MITKTKKSFFIGYLVFSAIWLGAAFHDTFSTNYTWYTDPLRYIKYTISNITPGAISPWPFSTILLLISAIIALILFIKYKGPGKKEAITSIAGTLVIIAITLVYFVPTLGKIFGDTNKYDESMLVTMSRTWVLLNVVRFLILVYLFINGLRALAKFHTNG